MKRLRTPHHLVPILFASLLCGVGCSRGGRADLTPSDGASAADLHGGDAAAPDLRPPPDLGRPQMSSRVQFGAAATYPVDALAFHFAAGRFNRGDAYPDLIIGGAADATVLIGKGDGTFSASPVALGVGSSWEVVAGDFNADGVDDIAIPDPRNARVVVALARGDGSFGAATGYPAGATPQSAAAVDLNGDGALDLVAGSYGTDQVHVFLNKGQGDGVLREAGTYPVAGSPIWIVAGDVNRDGRADLVVASYSGGAVSFFAGNGDGTLQPAQVITQLKAPVKVALGDVDLDGKLDLAVIRESERGILIYQGQGNGAFIAGAMLAVGADSGQSVRMADLNADGILDVVGACASTSPARVFLGRGDGTFLPEQLFPGAGSNVFDALPGDWDSDGHVDLALSDGSARKISILMNTTPR